jgi:hypothetical protein
LGTFNNYEEGSERLSAILATGLNKLLSIPDLYERARFQNIKLRWQTKNLLDLDPSPLSQLNRMLLEDAYPRELKRRLKERLPSAWGYEGKFEDKLTGRIFHAVWPVLEEAEILWQPHEFQGSNELEAERFVLPYYLRLQLEVCVYVPAREWSNVYRGAYFERDIRFRVRQCIPVKKGPIWKIRMPAIRQKAPDYSIKV